MQPRRLPPLTAGSRSHHAAQALRDAITSGVLDPGERLLETRLATQFGTSNGPVREALAQLETEGFVVRAPYRGAVVATVSQSEIEDVLVPVRITIERFAFAAALPLLTEDDDASLARLAEDIRSAELAGDNDRVAEADLQFHELVIQRSGHHHCLQLWRVIQPRVRGYFRRDADRRSVNGAIEPTVAFQHEQLLQSLRTRDPEQVQTAVDAHIRAHL